MWEQAFMSDDGVVVAHVIMKYLRRTTRQLQQHHKKKLPLTRKFEPGLFSFANGNKHE
jgi:hypothetical protein